MKTLNAFLTIGIVLLIAGILFSGCKKKEDPVIPKFTVSAITVQLQGGGEGLQFFATCTNDDVRMTKATIYDPLNQQNITYNTNGNTYVKGQAFDLQDVGTAYVKELGTWTFNFVGNRTADGASFSESATLSVTGK
jgi:hypothetical protein